jgi:hypothetical protein
MKYFWVLGIMVFLTGCGGAKNLSVQVKRPARITIPQSVQSVVLLNRSIPSSRAALEGAITLETPNRDKTLAGECLQGIQETLKTSDRFVVVRSDSALNAPDESSLNFGTPLTWEMVDSLCRHYKVDAILSIEFFDSDFAIHNPAGAAASAVGNILSGNNNTIEVRGTASANAGFRVYHSLQKAILYEDEFRFKKYYVQRSYTLADAMAKLIKKNQALREVSYATGDAFAKDIVPLFYWEERKIFKKGNANMKRGYRQAQSKNWEGARSTWIDIYTNDLRTKAKARAAHNVALSYEVTGDLSAAQKWIQQAYAERGKKIILRYSDILDFRIREQEKLKEQEGTGH